MKKRYQSGLLLTSLTTAALLFAGSQAFAYTHNNVVLRDANNNPIAAINNGDGTFSVPASAPAYSSETTCGTAGCHDYQAIERHSYHAQLGANQYMGWNAWAQGNWNSIATKGKPWVQSPGHVGKW